jgi:hypothetical protein
LGGAGSLAAALSVQFEERPQLPLTRQRTLLVGIGLVLFAVQLAGAAFLAAPTTGPGDAEALTFALLWLGSVVVSTAVTLCVIRQADIADVFTAALLATISPYALYALMAALNLRGTPDEVDLVSAIFLGVTTGGLTAVVVWAISMGIARLLRIPTSPASDDSGSDTDL